MEFGLRWIIWILISFIIYVFIGDYIFLHLGERAREIYGMRMIGDSVGVLLVFLQEIIYQLVKFQYKNNDENRIKK